jgi:hypothetical protein
MTARRARTRRGLPIVPLLSNKKGGPKAALSLPRSTILLRRVNDLYKRWLNA